MKEKRCNRCGQTKSVEDFYKRKSSTDGLNPWCKECYRLWHRDRYTSLGDDAPRTCERCGTEFTPKQRNGTQRFCSKNCKARARYWRENPKEQRTCGWCGADITHRRGSARFCLAECSQKNRNALVTPEQRRAARLWSRYKITAEAYAALLHAQDGACAICRAASPGTSHGFWHVDHCHTSGKVRGLLCSTCNTGLGSFRDHPVYLRRAADYLEAAASD
ncbi:endonuclease VII domain-containing protein [Streptomyces sp. 1222.5]|uniref:endonuclease VII domain-containing protein n=1 Tax=Streptomyces sp. 1222.5 TaxID=1881026 RepID=UPI003D705AD0